MFMRNFNVCSRSLLNIRLIEKMNLSSLNLAKLLEDYSCRLAGIQNGLNWPMDMVTVQHKLRTPLCSLAFSGGGHII